MKLQILLMCLILAAKPLAAQSTAQLQAELEAQREINELLKQRIRSLETELAAAKSRQKQEGTVTPVPLRGPAQASLEPEEERALERALVRRGSAVLPPGALEISPIFGWAYNGRDALLATDESYFSGLDARLGLENGWMIGAKALYTRREIQAVGSNSGFGDTTLTVWKTLNFPGSDPSYVASLSYSAPTGDDAGQAAVPLGSGFHTITGRISAVKTVDPVALFGDISFAHRLAERFAGVKVKRADAVGVGLGASLAITPDVSASTALRYVFEDDTERNGVSISGTSTTVGMLEIGFGMILKRDVFMNLNASFGVTDDAPDTQLTISFPMRF